MTRDQITGIRFRGFTRDGLIKFSLDRHGKQSPAFLATRAQLSALAAVLRERANSDSSQNYFPIHP